MLHVHCMSLQVHCMHIALHAHLLQALLLDAVGGYTPPLGRLPKLPEGEAWWVELPRPEPEEAEEDAAEAEAQMQAVLRRERGFGQAQAEAAASAQAEEGEGEEAGELDPATQAIIAKMRAAKLEAPARAAPADSAAGAGSVGSFFGSAKGAGGRDVAADGEAPPREKETGAKTEVWMLAGGAPAREGGGVAAVSQPGQSSSVVACGAGNGAPIEGDVEWKGEVVESDHGHPNGVGSGGGGDGGDGGGGGADEQGHVHVNGRVRSGGRHREGGDDEIGGGGESQGGGGEGRGSRGHQAGGHRREGPGPAEGVSLHGWSEDAAPHPDNAVLVAWERQQVLPSALAAVGTFADEEARAVGRWGERLLFETLRELGEPVTWVNEVQEQGLPFDVILERTPPTYIEVKSTISRSKQLFQLSVQELQFAQKMGDLYTVYRVYGAGSDDVSLASLRNLAQHLADGSLGLFVG